MSTLAWEPTTEIHKISEHWELCFQVDDTSSLYLAEWNRAKTMCSYYRITEC